MKFTAKLQINDDAIRAVKERLRGAPKRIHNHRISIGLHEDEAGDTKVDYHGKMTSVSVLEAAMGAEFGERSFIRTWYDQNIDRLKREMTSAMQAEYNGDESAVENQAARWGDELRSWITTGEARLKDLAPSTIASRNAAGLPEGPPLFATGQLVRLLRVMFDAQYV